MKIAIVTGTKHTKLFFLSCDYSGTLLYILSRSIIKGVRKKGEQEVDKKTKATDVSQVFLSIFSFLFFFVSYEGGYERRNGIQDSFRKGVAIKKDRRLSAKKKKMEERIIRKKKINKLSNPI